MAHALSRPVSAVAANSPLTTNRARNSNPPVLRLGLDHYGRRRAMRSGAFRRHMRQKRAGENEERLFHPCPRAGKLLARDSLSRSRYCRDLTESAMPLDPLRAIDSTSQTGEESFRAVAAGYAESIRNGTLRSDVKRRRRADARAVC